MTTPYVREWVAKAEEDYLSAEALLRRRQRPLPNSVCFHAHQCVEKYLKAVLTQHPGEGATVAEARRAVRLMRTVRAFIRERL